MRSLIRVVLLTALATSALSTVACGSSDPPGDEPVVDPALADVVFEGDASPAALEALLAAMAKSDPTRGAVIDSPPNDALLDPGAVTTFQWHPLGAAAGQRYFLVFSTHADPKLLRVFTSKTSYTPDDEAWTTLRSVAIWTTLTTLSATFAGDELAPGSGPFQGAPIEFCIER